MENTVFQSCGKLSSIWFHSETPLECSPNFPTKVPQTATLYVPEGTKASYQGVAPWSSFANIVEVGYGDNSFHINGIYYKIISDTDMTVEVTRGANKYTGDVVIPAQIEYNTKTYTVTEIGESAFAECMDLTAVTIPTTVTSIGSKAFMNCMELKSMSIPASVVSIGNWAFELCSSLEGFEVAEDNPAFAAADGILYDKNIETLICCPMTKMGEVVIPSTVTTIKNNAFAGCVELTSVVIPSSVTTIGYSAFNSCVSLSSLSIPSSVTSIGDGAFGYCENLKAVYCNWEEPLECSELFHESALLGATLYVPKGTVNKYQTVEPWSGFANIEEAVSIGDRLLVDGIYYVIMSDEERTVALTYGENPYTGELVIPSTVEFKGKTYNVTAIGDLAFCYSPELTAVSIPASVNTFSTSALVGATALETIDIAEDNQTYTSSDNVIYSKDMTTLVLCPPSRKGVFVVPASVTVIGMTAFQEGKGLTSVTLSDNVTRIENFAFSNCSGLTNMIIPAGVSYIGRSSFYANTLLESIDVAVTNETYTAFDGIIYTADMTSLVVCPSGKKGVVNIPATVTSIADDAFDYCPEITDITIPESVKTIGYAAFESCLSLTSVNIPASVESIGDGAFSSCIELKSVYCNWEEPLECESVFNDEQLPDATLYVPKGTADKYKAVAPWKNFGRIEEMVSTGVDDIDGAGAVIVTVEGGAIRVNGLGVDAAVTVYDYAGRMVFSGKDNVISNLPAGLYIVRVGSVRVKVSI